MAESSISVDHDQFSCPVCLDLLKDPVTVPCGHSFCMCRETFTPRPVLRRNNMLAEVVEKLKKNTELQAASPAPRYAGAGDVECDFCTGRKLKAIKSCLMCLASFCEAHLKPHYEVPGLKKHNLVKASTQLQEKICSQHVEVMKIYCRTDQRSICYLCTMEEHKGHDTVSATTERTRKQRSPKEKGEKEKGLGQQRKQTSVEDSERIFTELIRSIEKKRSEVTELIRDQEKAELSGAEELLEKLQQEMADSKEETTLSLEQLSHTEDHIHFLQVSSLSVSLLDLRTLPASLSIQHPSFDGVRKSLSELKERLEEFCREEFREIPPHGESCTTLHHFLYFCRLTLDPNTANRFLILSEKNRVVKNSDKDQPYSDHPERFDFWLQVLSKESVCGRCYWEVEWSGGCVFISVSYKGVSRKGGGDDRLFGFNSQSWSLRCSSSLSFFHNNIQTDLSAPPSSRIGVYVDHSAGTLSFYSVSDTMTLLHTLHTKFTQPLYAGFYVTETVRISVVKKKCVFV
uniref:Tripartite motif-containing protein 16-like n=1 Tax=Astyanax mexicanus TaxID=7994 RepID=A0A3B1J0B1_ASTMX